VPALGNLRTKIHADELAKVATHKHAQTFRKRFLIAASSGLALIAPMLIMTLHPTKLTSLLTTSLFVIVVALILARVMDEAQNKDIVAATAAYAAVLVVFVGTTMTPGA
jgi:hypothetical protein